MAEYVVEYKDEGMYATCAKERIVRCRDCKHAVEHCDTEKLDCTHFSQWDYYEDEPGHWPVEPDGFCAWGERRDE